MPSLDLHVLSTPPAFVLSQDQTLQQNLRRANPSNSKKLPEITKQSLALAYQSTLLSSQETSTHGHVRPRWLGHTTHAVLPGQISMFPTCTTGRHARRPATRLGSRTSYEADHRTGRSQPSMADLSGSRGSRVSFPVGSRLSPPGRGARGRSPRPEQREKYATRWVGVKSDRHDPGHVTHTDATDRRPCSFPPPQLCVDQGQRSRSEINK